MKWRQEVLTRVNQLLILLLEKNQTEYQWNTVDIVFDQGKSCPLYMKRNFDVRLNIQKPGHLSVNDSNSPSLHIQGFASQILPLLIETWVEAMASEQLNKDQSTSLTAFQDLLFIVLVMSFSFDFRLLTYWNREYRITHVHLQCDVHVVEYHKAVRKSFGVVELVPT